MNYQNIYDRLIKRSKDRLCDINIYYESHHIVPKCLGGSNKKDNKVFLTGREHFIAHWLLYRIYPDNKKIAIAFFFMSHCLSRQRDYKVSSRTYSEAREAHQKATKGRKISEEQKIAISKANKGRKLTDREKQRVSEVHKGKTISPEQISILREASKGKKLSQEHKNIISEVAKRKSECPHCGIVGQNRNMKRWHFDRCKNKSYDILVNIH